MGELARLAVFAGVEAVTVSKVPGEESKSRQFPDIVGKDNFVIVYCGRSLGRLDGQIHYLYKIKNRAGVMRYMYGDDFIELENTDDAAFTVGSDGTITSKRAYFGNWNYLCITF